MHFAAPTSLDGINDEYYRHLEDDVNREKRVDKCRTSKKSIQYIDHTKNRSTTYLKRSGSLILAVSCHSHLYRTKEAFVKHGRHNRRRHTQFGQSFVTSVDYPNCTSVSYLAMYLDKGHTINCLFAL